MNKQNTIIIAAFLVGLLIGSILGRRHGSNDNSENEVVYAYFNGGQILGKDILPLIQNDVKALQSNLYEVKVRTTTEQSKHFILEAAAKKKNMTGDQLLADYRKQHVDDPISDEDVAGFVGSQGLNFKSLTAEQRETYKRTLRDVRIMNGQNAVIDDIVKSANLRITVPKP